MQIQAMIFAFGLFSLTNNGSYSLGFLSLRPNTPLASLFFRTQSGFGGKKGVITGFQTTNKQQEKAKETRETKSRKTPQNSHKEGNTRRYSTKTRRLGWGLRSWEKSPPETPGTQELSKLLSEFPEAWPEPERGKTMGKNERNGL